MPIRERVRVGVIGTSTHVANTHLSYLKSHPRCDLAAICGRNPGRAQAVAARFEIPQVFTDYRRMLDDAELDAVVVASPDDLHYGMTMDVLDRGLHVLCEKPLAGDAAQARAMYRRAEEQCVKHMTFFSWRWLPPQRYTKVLIDQGAIGRPFDCEIDFRGGYGRSPTYAWRFDAARSPGVLGDLGSHAIDLASWYLGPVARISAHTATFIERPAAPGTRPRQSSDSAIILIEFTSGAHGTIQVSAVSHVGEREMEQRITLHGEDGAIEATYTAPASGLQYISADQQRFHHVSIPPEFAGSAPASPFRVFRELSVGDRLFIDAILDDRPICPSFREGLSTQLILDAAAEAARSGHWIPIPEDAA